MIARQASYDARELSRVLCGGGTFLTQQIDSSSHEAIRCVFGRATDPFKGTLPERVAAQFEEALESLERAGFDEVSVFKERQPSKLKIADVKATLCYEAGSSCS